jgi:hypothetical protein
MACASACVRQNVTFFPIHVLSYIVRFTKCETLAFLNYHHLRCFRAIATEDSLNKAAQNLKLS